MKLHVNLLCATGTKLNYIRIFSPIHKNRVNQENTVSWPLEGTDDHRK